MTDIVNKKADERLRYAVDLGVCSSFAGQNLPKGNQHFFVSALPWLKHVDRKSAYAFLQKLKQLNQDVAFGLLELEQIEQLNRMGASAGFAITNCWTSSTYDDWHGRVDGYYSLVAGREVVDRGDTKTDVYVVFGFVPEQEKSIILP